jgi:FkbM family methyltransferase
VDGVAARLVSRIFRALGLRQHEIDRLRARLAVQERAASSDAASWRDSRRRLKAAAERAKALAASFSLRMLSGDVIQELLPYRLRTIAARRVYADADRYEQRLRETSAAYRDAVASDSDADLATVDIHGVTWTVPAPASIAGVTRDRFVREQHFPYRTIAETREFAVGPVLIDIGANCGLTSIPRVILGDVTRAYCAEPDPLNFAALVRNVTSNGLGGLVLPDQAAIGAINGHARLQRAKYPGGHRIVPDAVAADATIEVDSFTLDAWCDRMGIDPELVVYIKVDVQGSEVSVLLGATRLLGFPHIAWQIEVNPRLLLTAGASADTLCDLCATHFTHFVDLDKQASGPRARPTRELRASIEGLAGRAPQTDIILFKAGERLDRRMERWAERWKSRAKD